MSGVSSLQVLTILVILCAFSFQFDHFLEIIATTTHPCSDCWWTVFLPCHSWLHPNEYGHCMFISIS